MDYLRGLKENVVVGRLIPAGTGLACHAERKRKRSSREQERSKAAPSIGISADEMEAKFNRSLRRELNPARQRPASAVFMGAGWEFGVGSWALRVGRWGLELGVGVGGWSWAGAESQE